MKYYILLLLPIICISCKFIISGYYTYAERYTFDLSSHELITKIKDFKEKNPEYKVMTTFENGEKGELQDRLSTNNRTYSIWFFYSDLHITVHCFISMSKETLNQSTTIGLASMTKSKNFGGWKSINTKDLSKEENAQIKEMFETQILDKLGKWERE